MRRILAVVALFVFATAVRADVLLTETQTVFTGPVPVEQAFTPTAAQAGALDLTVVDTAFPAPLKAIRIAVTQGGTVVKTLSTAGTLTFTATAGTEYVIRVLGTPDPIKYSGAVVASVTPSGQTSPVILTFPAAFKLPVPETTTLNLTLPLTIPEAGDYTFTLTDFAFPTALAPASSAQLFLGATALGVVPFGTPTTFHNLAASSGSTGAYTLTILAQADTTAAAGLFGLRVVGGPSGNVVFPDTSNPSGVTALGTVPAPIDVANPAGGSVALQVADLQFPAPMATLGALLSTGGQAVARQCVAGCAAAGNVAGGATSPGTLQLWRIALAGTQPGSYSVGVNAGGTALYSDVEAVTPAGATGNAFAFPFTLPTAGSYTAQVTDFQFPSALPALQYSVTQNGAVVAQSASGGSVSFNAAAGAATLLVVAQAPNGTPALFGAQVLTTGASPMAILDETQAVGAAFSTRSMTDAVAGSYDVTLTDASWPAPFQQLWVAVTRGGQLAGKVLGGGTFQLNATPGDYLVTLIAKPSATEQAGLFSLAVQSSVPSVTLSADQSTIMSGQSVRLTWSSNAATGCVASGDWSGSQSTSGSGVSAGPLTKTSTFTLTCSGPGGNSTPASVTVTVTRPPASGGGGALDAAEIAALVGLAVVRSRRARAGQRPKSLGWSGESAGR